MPKPSHTRAEQVNLVMEALNRQDFETLTEVLHADVEHHSVFAAVEGEIYRGIDGQRTRWANVTSTWDEFHVDVDEVTEDGDEATVVLHLTGVAHASRMPLDAQLVQTWTWRDGKVALIVTRS